MIEVAAGFVAWLGASMVVLADARRGLALGIAIATLGLAVLVLQDAGPLEAAAMALGGLLASARCASSGPAGWQIMPPITWHNGGTGGFGTYAGMRRDADAFVVILTNSFHGLLRSVDQSGRAWLLAQS